MGETTGIEWCDHTFNPWIGCAKVSPGCAHCYAERDMDHRRGRVKWGVAGTRSRTSVAYWKEPYAWARAAKRDGVRRRVFCASLADVFEDREELAPWRAELFTIIAGTPELDWLLLTKRPENIVRLWPGTGGTPVELVERGGHGVLPNVWLGTSVEDQARADERVPMLLSVPAAVRFLSCEPLLGAVDLTFLPAGPQEGNIYFRFNALTDGVHAFRPGFDWKEGRSRDPAKRGDWDENSHWGFARKARRDCYCEPIDWVIVGGESGPDARPMHPQWVRGLRDQCEASQRAAFLFKQWGDWCPQTVANSEAAAASALYLDIDGSTRDANFGSRRGSVTIQRVGKKAAGRKLDGRTWDEYPQGRAVAGSGSGEPQRAGAKAHAEREA